MPVIIDCGGNIGLSVLYFKYLFPNSVITVFEPSPPVFEILKENI
jgi:FkbM family methyltransferase